MSESMNGSKSILYSKEDIPGLPGTGDNFQHLSIQEAVGKRGSADVVIHGSAAVSTGHTVDAGSVKKKIVSTAHGAKRGWIMRPTSGNSTGEEISIIEIIDANTFAIAYEADLAIGDTFELCKLITPKYTLNGELNVVVTPGPVIFDKDGSDTEVKEDTADPTQNNQLPVKTIKYMEDTLVFDYSVTSVDDTAWVELITNSGNGSKYFTWFDSCGYAMEIGIGAIGLETRLFVVPPGGFNGEIPIPIPPNARVSIKCLEVQTVNTGLIIANFLN